MYRLRFNQRHISALHGKEVQMVLQVAFVYRLADMRFIGIMFPTQQER